MTSISRLSGITAIALGAALSMTAGLALAGDAVISAAERRVAVLARFTISLLTIRIRYGINRHAGTIQIDRPTQSADPDWSGRALPFFVEPVAEIAAIAPLRRRRRAVFSLFCRC